MSSQAYIYNPTERTLAAAGDGFSCPRLTTTGRTALTLTAGDKGMMVYDTTLTTLCIWTGAAWEFINDNSNAILSVKDFGAKGDGVTDDTVAVQAGINAVVAEGGGSLYFPTGTYKLIDTLTVDTGVYTKGIILFGEGRNSILNQTGVGKDCINFSTTQILQNSGLRDMKITCSAVSGHCVNIVYGCTTCFISNVDIEQSNPSKSVLYGDYTTFGAGVYDTKFSGGSWYCNSASTASGVKFVANGTIFNENIFENLRCYNSKTLQFFHISTVTTPTIWLINNVWRNINFEICPGGGIRFDSFKNCAFQNISFWDAAGAYTNHLIDMQSGTGYESVSNTFINVGRNGDSLAAGIYDIRITSGVSSTLVNCFTQAGDGPSYNFNNKSVTMIGATVGTFVNTAGLFKVGNPFGQIQFANTVNGAFLNYYDEGTWNATLAGTGSDPTVPVVTTGVWTRIGRQVFATAHFVNVNTTGGGGNLVVVGLPFPVTIANGFGPASIQGLGANPIVALPLAGSTQIDLRIATSTATNLAYGAGLNKYLSFTVTYTA